MMKKRLLSLLLAALMLLSLAACGGNTPAANGGEAGAGTQSGQTAENTDSSGNTEESITVEGDPVEYSQSYWEEKYPGANICPFSIHVDGVDYPYYWISTLVPEDDIASWATTEMNWNGWHMAGDKLVDQDEKYAITQESREMSFSSCCVYYTEPYNPSGAAESAETTGYNFRGYTETADWPGADMWESYGLPELALDEDVSGTVHISDKNWIYPLNGSDGIMVEVRVTTRHLEELMEILNNSGVSLEETDEYINEGYSFCYQNGGTRMKLQIAEWEIDVNDYKLSITIITEPTD